MDKLAAPKLTTTKQGGPNKSLLSSNARRIFIAAVIDMTWRLALVILVPVIGGVELDRHLHSAPLFIIIGFVLAMVGMYVVMRRVVAAANQLTVASKGRK